MRPILILQNCSDEPAGTILDYLAERELPHRTIHTYREALPDDSQQFDAVINLGCPTSMTQYRDHEFLRNLFAFVSDVVRRNQHYLGICFSGQMLAAVLGARVEANPVKEIGNYELRLTEAGLADPLFAGFKQTFPVFHWHGDTFRIPHGAELLAEGDDCRNQAFRKDRQVAVQFHLEMTADTATFCCDAYPDELREVGKTREQVLADIAAQADELKLLNFRLLDNFLSL